MTARVSERLAASLASQRATPPRRSKFGNKPTVVDDIRFASGREARRYRTLKLLQQAGEISDLALQPRFPLVVNGKLVCTYVGDFSYLTKSGQRVVEDAKGHRTREYINKANLFEALHGFAIVEV